MQMFLNTTVLTADNMFIIPNIEQIRPDQSSLNRYDFLVTVKGAPHECVIRTGQP